ncbi:MAG: 50S ribosomal protein L18 [Proteobacteria bacterium]|nr:50S ribosomal protein L18 [Pseudomonadota bacterium]
MAKKVELRARRKLRIRKKVTGTPQRPRLSVFRSARHITAQVIDDITGKTLVAIHSYEVGSRANKEVCSKLGKDLAVKCIAVNISAVVFDKNGYQYHGRIQALADGAREGGLKF